MARDEPLTFREAQERVDRWIGQYKAGYWPPLANLARLIEETGELARLLNHLEGHKPKKTGEADQDLGLELADIIYTVICIANSKGIDLEDAFNGVMRKVETRDRDRYERKEET
ncbi:MAG: nucleotide pyrophosphohydrolase [Chloroflexota bacterium]|nr:nucleotide pyrophosphohydrolase [Chloroflexota bacterium]